MKNLNKIISGLALTLILLSPEAQILVNEMVLKLM
jgi:hypothetical protein